MDYVYLGRTGVKVSSLCFGTMSFGGIADESTSRKMFDRCRDAGINFFDCANVYERGRSEELLGKFIADCRDEVFITSKVFFPTGKDVNARGASRYHIMQEVEHSLRRLNTDRIDLYFIHHFDAGTPIEETLRALNDLVQEGKVLYLGASNFAAWQVAKALGISKQMGWSRFECIQPMYNLVKRQVEVELLPMAQSEEVGVISYSPLAGGILTGKYSSKQDKPKEGRLLTNKMYQLRYGDEAIQEMADSFTDFAADHGFDPVSLAIAWVQAHPSITAPIIGARNLQQLEPSINAIEIPMTHDLWQNISLLSPEPAPATDRNEERKDYDYGKR
ncbi:MAG: aldo/keto reductase [Saprospiraceae bacterium]|nr:aldo/keto reductase [Saprospiraceae bacterium]